MQQRTCEDGDGDDVDDADDGVDVADVDDVDDVDDLDDAVDDAYWNNAMNDCNRGDNNKRC